MEGTRRANIKPGIEVMVELAKDKRTERLTEGIVKKILPSAPDHPHGIKVMLENGQAGRIKQIIRFFLFDNKSKIYINLMYVKIMLFST